MRASAPGPGEATEISATISRPSVRRHNHNLTQASNHAANQPGLSAITKMEAKETKKTQRGLAFNSKDI